MGAAPSAAPAAHTTREPGHAGSVSFIRGSGEGRYQFEVQTGLTLGTTAQDIGPIDIKAYDYMRSILLWVQTTTTGTSTGSATASKDFPLNAISYLRVKQPNGQTMYSVSSGHHAGMIHKYGMVRPVNTSDPRADINFSTTPITLGTSSTTKFNFGIRIPFELDLRDALGALPNKDAAAPFTLELGLNPTSTLFTAGWVAGTNPVISITPVLEAYDQPPEMLDGKAVDVTPPNMNSLQRWTEQSVTMVTGAFDARVRKLGNYLRMLIAISKNSSGVRIVNTAVGTTPTGWSDPVQIVLDEDVKDNVAYWLWLRDIWEIWGFGGSGFGGTGAAVDTPGGQDDGVFPYQYCVDRRSVDVENVAKYLPTIESEDYLLRGQNWGTNVSKMVFLKCEVLPRGDIFGDA